jgi:hypothetical protein
LRFVADVYGDRFTIHDWTLAVRRNIDDLARIPAGVHQRIAQFLEAKGGNAGLYFGEGGAPGLDDLGHLSGQAVPGYPDMTFDQLPAVFGEARGVVAVGTGTYGSASAALHEVGHLVDWVYGPADGRASELPAFRQAYEQVVKEAPEPGMIRPHYREKQKGDGGAQEMFAEAFDVYHLPDSERQLADLAGSAAGGHVLKEYFDTLLGHDAAAPGPDLTPHAAVKLSTPKGQWLVDARFGTSYFAGGCWAAVTCRDQVRLAGRTGRRGYLAWPSGTDRPGSGIPGQRADADP